MNYLLDTNIVVTYLRNTEVTRRLEDQLNLLSGENNLVVSVVSLGEIRSIARRNNWGEKKLMQLENIVKGFLIADIHMEEIIEKYAEIDAYSQGKLKGEGTTFSSRNMGKNDLWIAATASVFDLELLTTDKDFDHLNSKYLKMRVIDLSRV
ncbi:MAG: PIN domain-containing protein [Saprospiraceae bacterium]|jgi:tRNA(fMet)-specific endonuclease VapC|nr:PIN domain-containing protein [Saprospiraceae bacterium]